MNNIETYEYKMPAAFAANLLKESGKKGKSDKQAYLINYVNEQCGLNRKCSKVIIE